MSEVKDRFRYNLSSKGYYSSFSNLNSFRIEVFWNSLGLYIKGNGTHLDIVHYNFKVANSSTGWKTRVLADLDHSGKHSYGSSTAKRCS